LLLKLFAGSAISGWASLLIGIMTFGGVQLLMLGILGEYLGKVLLEVKGRPSYIVREQSEPAKPSQAESPVAAMQARLSNSPMLR
jgi:polyisoprenyl-phosphate glycosyltransferase